MVATVAAGTTAEYYTALADYYAGGSEPQGRWLAVGLAIGAGTGDAVDSKLFALLHAGCDAAGRRILANDGGKVERVGGYDVTFSAPKSISVAWALADAELRVAIERAQETAVRTGLAALERNAAFCRSGKGGSRREPVKLTVAAFQHGGARPDTHADGAVFSDPNLHTHAVVLNLGQKADGRCGALDGKALFAWKMAAGATYHAALAKELGDLGFAITDIVKNGTFELKGLDPNLKRYFSTRRQTIEEELSAAGLMSGQAPALAAAVARATRKQKRDLKGDDRFATWREHAEALGHAPDLVLDAMMTAGQAQREIEREDTGRAIKARIDDVLQALTEHDSVFQRQHLHAALAASLVGLRVGPERVEGEINACVASGKLVMLAPDRWGHAIMTTPEMLAIEREIGAIASRLQRGPRPAHPLTGVEQRIFEGRLNDEQGAAVRAATVGNAITIIEGAPGSGKTTTLRPIKESFEAAGYRVVGSAAAWRIATMLRDDLGIEARATDSWLARQAAGLPFLDSRSVLIVDEAGLLSSRQMHQLLRAVEDVQNALGLAPRLILVGDREQLQSVGAGSGLGLVAGVLSTQRVEAIQRQREPWVREAILQFGKGQAPQALEAFVEHGGLHEHDGGAATVRALVDAWEAAGGLAAGDGIHILAKTNVQVRAIGAEVRRRLRAQNLIWGEDVGIAAVTRSGHGLTLPLAAGDRVTFLARLMLGDRKVINGTRATIEKVTPAADGTTRIAALIDGERVVFSPQNIADEHGRARLAHAYATTIHGAQGLTSERSLVLLTPEMDRHDIYVAASRARGRTDFFVDRKALEAAARAELPLNQRVAAIDEDAGRSYLATRLARAGTKLTTLDVIAAAAELPPAEPTRVALDTKTQEPRSRGRRRGLALE